MKTQCKLKQFEFEALGRRKVVTDFTGGQISSDGGALLLRETDLKIKLTERLADCFIDYRKQDLVDHSVRELIAQRIYGLALGYEDLNDHEQLSKDPLLATTVGKIDPAGNKRRHQKDRGIPLASSSTLGRVERTPSDADSKSRYEKVVCNVTALEQVFFDIFVESIQHEPKCLILDFNPSDVELHGNQEQVHYHGYYRHPCYLPMYVFCGEFPLSVRIRPSNIDGPLGAALIAEILVTRLRSVWLDVHIILRADSDFSRDELMAWCESNNVDFVFDLGKNSRLETALKQQREQARRKYLRSNETARVFRNFNYRTRKSWSRKRRIIGKVEYNSHGYKERFVVTSLLNRQYEKRYVYEELYCARGEAENRIKEEQLDLFGDRASSHTYRGNAIRIALSTAAHLLVLMLRNLGLKGTELSNAQANTLRCRLFKIGALVDVSVRRVYIRLSSAFPLQNIFAQAFSQLRLLPVPSG